MSGNILNYFRRNTLTPKNQLALSFPSSINKVFIQSPTKTHLLSSGWASRDLTMIQVFPDTTSFDLIDRDTIKNTMETQLTVIGGTMGLLTGKVRFKSSVRGENKQYIIIDS